VRTASRGVAFEGGAKTAYAACLELMTASRILVELTSGPAPDEEDLYRLALDHPWETVFNASASFACRVTGVPRDKDPRYANLKLKDAVADRFNKVQGQRPSVDRRSPDIRVETRWNGRTATVYLNLSGPPLHERGYKLERTKASLRETTAATILALAEWPRIAAEGGGFVDPMCGSGTLLAEAAMMAAGLPPGVRRKNWGFKAWKAHDERLWADMLRDATIRYGEGLERVPRILGLDNNDDALRIAKANLRRAGLNTVVRLEKKDIITDSIDNWPRTERGLVCADPPYGHRIETDPAPLYAALGESFRSLGPLWRMALLAPDKQTASASHLRAEEYYSTVSGGMDLILAVYDRHGGVPRSATPRPAPPTVDRPAAQVSDSENAPTPPPDPKAPSLKKTLVRNIAALSKWADKTGVTSYRIWDSDMPEFNAAVDWYEGRWLHVQEFAPPGKVPPEKSRRRLHTLLSILQECTGIDDDHLYLKTRQRGIRPYGKMADKKDKLIIKENGARFFINLTDYLDSGIFLDHRPTRALIRDRIGTGRFLNLFAYTGTASVMAGLGGASKTVSVDVSNTYLDWGKENIRLNRLDESRHMFVRSDAFAFLKGSRELF
jgi:23S rRNA (guanine2445-N2)-methyltransferase / 23S rRNA (guanine2069-N7)-methyltransferase